MSISFETVTMGSSSHEKIKILDRWDVCRHRLENGLRILLLEDHSTPLISFHSWFRVGSRHEKPGKTGLAHLFEHLMFESTRNHPSGMFDREMERYGAETNAATWMDWTYYHETFPPEALGLVMEIEPDRMINLILDQEVVEREKSVVANERKYRVDDRIDGLMEEIMYKTAFRVHPYRHPTIGWMEDIKNFTLEDCTAFYRTYYSPGNATIVVAGDFDHDALIDMLEERYGNIPAQDIPDETVPDEPEQKTERRIALKKEVSAPKAAIGYHSPGLAHLDNAALSILGVILCGGDTGRLVRRFVHEEELASEVYAWVGNFKFPALFEFHIDLREGGNTERAVSITDEELSKVCLKGISEDELKTAKNRVLLGTFGGFMSVGGKAAGLGFYETVLDDCGAITERLERLRRVDAEDVVRAAEHYFKPSRRTIVTVVPVKP